MPAGPWPYRLPGSRTCAQLTSVGWCPEFWRGLFGFRRVVPQHHLSERPRSDPSEHFYMILNEHLTLITWLMRGSWLACGETGFLLRSNAAWQFKDDSLFCHETQGTEMEPETKLKQSQGFSKMSLTRLMLMRIQSTVSLDWSSQ